AGGGRCDGKGGGEARVGVGGGGRGGRRPGVDDLNALLHQPRVDRRDVQPGEGEDVPDPLLLEHPSHELPAGHHPHRWSPAWRRSAGRRRTAGSRLSPVHDPFQDLSPLAGTYATALAREAFARGLATTAPDGTRNPITPGATPVVLPSRVIAERHNLARILATAGFKMAQAMVLGPS